MFSDAVLFSLAAIWFYLALLLAWQDRRWHRARIAQFACLGAITGLLFRFGRGDASAAGLALLLFLAFALLPLLLERRLLGHLVAGQEVGRWQWLCLHLLMWGRAPWALEQLAHGVAALRAGEVTQGTARLEPLLGGPWSVAVRVRYLAWAIHALVQARCFAEAVFLFERHWPLAHDAASADMLHAMARAYAECSRPQQALGYLWAAEQRAVLGRHEELERFTTRVAVFALCGQVDAVERTLSEGAAKLLQLPRPFAPYWRGVAHLAAGAPEQADECFRQAVAACSPAEERLWREAIAIRRQAIKPTAGAIGEEELTLLAGVEAASHARRHAAPPTVPRFGGGIAPVTAALLMLNIVVWVAMELTGSSTEPTTLVQFGANLPAAALGGEYWRLVSSMFLHVGLAHLLFNGYALYLFGTFVERWCGKREMFFSYMLAGIVGSAASAWLGNHAVSAGASGAIFGLLGVAIGLVLRYRQSFPAGVRRLYLFNLIYIAGLQLLFGTLEAGVDNYAHAGGFSAGLALGLVLRRRWLRPWRTALAVGMAAVLGATAWATVRHALGAHPSQGTVEVVDTRHNIRLQVPRRWTRELSPDGQLVLVDRWAHAALVVRVEHLRGVGEDEADLTTLLELQRLRLLASGEKWLGALEQPRRLKLGTRVYYQLRLHHGAGDEEMVRDRYFTLAREALYEFDFECRVSAYGKQYPIFRRILASFRPADEFMRFKSDLLTPEAPL